MYKITTKRGYEFEVDSDEYKVGDMIDLKSKISNHFGTVNIKDLKNFKTKF